MTTRTLKVSVAALIAAVALAGAAGCGTSADPVIGTWTLNLSKSTYSPGPAPQSGTATFSADGDRIKLVVAGVTATGDKAEWGYSASHDGKDFPITGMNPDADTISLRRIDDRTVESTNKRAGQVTITNRREVSADGKTMTVTTTGTNAQGQAVKNVQVFDRS